MWTALALAACLGAAPGQSGSLTLTNVRATHGPLGPTRTTSNYLPGDQLVLSFTIDGIRADPNGKVLYSIGMEATDSKGASVFKQAPRDQEAIASLGGRSLPAQATVNIGLDQPAGSYTLKVTVTDRAASASRSLSHTFQVLPKGFGLVRLNLSADPEGQAPESFVGEGQSVFVNFGAVGFSRGANKQPNVEVELRVLDETGRPTTAQPMRGAVKDNLPEKAASVPMQFLLFLNRGGKFTVEVTAIDQVTRKTGRLSIPLNVQAMK